MQYLVQADGGSRGNPGPAGSGALILDDAGNTVFTVSEFLGTTTNNVAEYTAIVRALEGLAEVAGAKGAEVRVEMDSELVVKQMRGEYKIKHPNLKPLAARVSALLPQFRSVSFFHIPRAKNARADALANAAMDRGS